MRAFSLLLLLLFGVRCFDSAGQINDDSPIFINSSIDLLLNINVFVQKKPHFTGTVTGFKLYFTKDSTQPTDEYERWQQLEVSSTSNSHSFTLDAKQYSITSGNIYRIRATVFFNDVESNPSGVVTVNTRMAAPKAPLIVNTKILHNSSVLISFVPSDDVNLIENYTLLYKKMEEGNWQKINFKSDFDGKVLLDGLIPNETYNVKMFVSGTSIQGIHSNIVTFTTNSTALASIKTDPIEKWELDPQTSDSLSVKCTVKSSTPATVYWRVNGIKVSVDSSFYTVTTTVHEEFVESTIRAKSRTRSAVLSCVASNDAGDTAKDVQIIIKGPGSPPSEITLVAEKRGYTIAWKPPSHPNGEITKYVVYHTLNREDPLSDWRKIDLDGSEKFVSLIIDTDESFYGRVQAATALGPGIISDIVAMERDTQPINITMELNGEFAEKMVVDPRELLSIQCAARGKPRPSLSVAISDRKNASLVEVDVWNRLQVISSSGTVTAMHNFSILTTKFVHCRAKNSAGSNYSTIELRADKPGDAPTHVQVLSVNAHDATIIWKSLQFPNLPITSYIILVSKDIEEDKSVWLQYETSVKELSTNRFSLPTASLEKSTQYYVCVRAKNTAGIGPISDTTYFTTLNGGPDAPPSNLKILINEANQVILTWNSPNSTTEVTSYLIYYTRDLSLSNEDYPNWQVLEIPADDHCRYKFDHSVGLKPKTIYRVRIVGKNSHADGPASELVEFETAYSELPIPTDLKTELMDDNTVHIKFSAVRDPDDHSKAIDSYRIDLAATDDVLHAQWKTIEPKALRIDEITSMVDVEIDGSTVEKNRMYWVKATARLDNPAWGLHSSKPRWFRTGHGKLVTTVTLDGAPLIEKEPNILQKLSILCTGIGSPAPIITWEWYNRTIENGTDNWMIYSTLVDDTTILSKLERDGVQESGDLTCVGVNNEGNSSMSLEVRILGPGDAPGKLHLIAYRNQINVTWQEPKYPNGDIMKYIVYYSETGETDLTDWLKFETAEVETYIESFGPLKKHYVKVQAVSGRGVGIISDAIFCYSDELYETLKMDISASNILDFEAEPNQNVELICKGSGRPTPKLFYKFGNMDEKEFEEVEVSDDGIYEATAPQINSRRNLTVECRAENKYENMTMRREIIIRRPGEAPSNITWSFLEDDDSSLYINWTPIENPNGQHIEYNLYLSNFKTKVAGPPVRVPEIPLNVNITLRISAENENGEGEKSFPIWIPTPNGGPKTPPVLSSLHAENRKVFVSWEAPRLSNGDIMNYTVYFRKMDEEKWMRITFHPNTTHVTLDESDGLEENAKYELRMTATNERNEGPTSQIYTFDLISFDETDIITNFTATVINSTIYITVSEPLYTKYNIYIHDEVNNNTMKHEIDVEPDCLNFDFEFQLDHELDYSIRMSGMKYGRESPQSDGVDVVFIRHTNTTEVVTTPSSVTPTRRNVVKEPPL